MAADKIHAELAPAETYPVAPDPAPNVADVPVAVVANQVADVASDAARLVELQVKLFGAELRQSGKQLIQPIAVIAGTGMVALAGIVILLLALGTGLHELFGMPLSVSLLIAALLGFAGAYAALRYALELFKTPRISFDKSKEELMRNAAFLSRVMKSR